jgi:hypothetical protein
VKRRKPGGGVTRGPVKFTRCVRLTAHPDHGDHRCMGVLQIRRKREPTPVVTGGIAELTDEMLDRYVEWREDAAAVADTYRRWSVAPANEEAMWFSAYMAALEMEEFTAASYAEAIRALSRPLRDAQGGSRAEARSRTSS